MDKRKVTDKSKFKTVDFFRKVKEKVAKETYDMTFLELKAYLKQRKLQTQTK